MVAVRGPQVNVSLGKMVHVGRPGSLVSSHRGDLRHRPRPREYESARQNASKRIPDAAAGQRKFKPYAWLAGRRFLAAIRCTARRPFGTSKRGKIMSPDPVLPRAAEPASAVLLPAELW